jgi:hypothetical protein
MDAHADSSFSKVTCNSIAISRKDPDSVNVVSRPAIVRYGGDFDAGFIGKTGVIVPGNLTATLPMLFNRAELRAEYCSSNVIEGIFNSHKA